MTLVLFSVAALADDNAYEFGGHTKFRLLGQSYPDDSLFRDLVGSTSLDAAGELRLDFSTKKDQWSVFADYQLLALHSEFLPAGLPSDERRFFDFTISHPSRGQEVLAVLMQQREVNYFDVRRPSLHEIFVQIAGPQANEELDAEAALV